MEPISNAREMLDGNRLQILQPRKLEPEEIRTAIADVRIVWLLSRWNGDIVFGRGTIRSIQMNSTSRLGGGRSPTIRMNGAPLLDSVVTPMESPN